MDTDEDASLLTEGDEDTECDDDVDTEADADAGDELVGLRVEVMDFEEEYDALEVALSDRLGVFDMDGEASLLTDMDGDDDTERACEPERDTDADADAGDE